MPKPIQYQLAAGQTVTGRGTPVENQSIGKKAFYARVDGSGSVSATVVLEGSNDGKYWVTLATLTLSGTTSASDGAITPDDVPFVFLASNVTAISGTGAAVISNMGG